MEDIKGITIDESSQTWRMRERMKTVSVALVVCLNIGVDPPDVRKTEPCARMECWIHPLTLNSQRALETIGNNLQKQYERWQPRARYRQSLDPTVEEVRRLGMISHKKSLITVFGHKHEIKNFIKKLYIFHEKILTAFGFWFIFEIKLLILK